MLKSNWHPLIDVITSCRALLKVLKNLKHQKFSAETFVFRKVFVNGFGLILD